VFPSVAISKEGKKNTLHSMDTNELNRWAAMKVRALIRRLMQHLASEHEKAAAELRKASR
jgi:hypothetical protein